MADTADILLFGATGFVGRLTARHLATHHGDLAVVLAGRDVDKLTALRDELNPDWEVATGDAHSATDMAVLAAGLGTGQRVRGAGHRLRRPVR